MWCFVDGRDATRADDEGLCHLVLCGVAQQLRKLLRYLAREERRIDVGEAVELVHDGRVDPCVVVSYTCHGCSGAGIDNLAPVLCN